MEAAAALLVAHEVISTTIEAAVVAGIALTRPTNRLTATFSKIASVPQGEVPDSLARAYHSLNIVDGDLYIWGGKVSPDRLAGNEMHIIKLSNIAGPGIDYKCVPALARDGEDVPQARAGHTTSVIDNKLVMFGGYGDPNGSVPLHEDGSVWIFDPATLQWSRFKVANIRHPQCHSHAAAVHGNSLIIHGGYSCKDSLPGMDTWSFDMTSHVWKELPSLKTLPGSPQLAASAPPSVALVNEKLYVIGGSSNLEGQVHILDLAESSPGPAGWTVVTFPTNPLIPGPRPRKGGGLVPISTARGRHYLLMVLGAKETHAVTEDASPSKDNTAHSNEDFWSALWALQLASSDYTPPQLKDATREQINMNTGEAQWGEVEILPPSDDDPSLGKIHPGPRGYFAAAVVDACKIVIWGGINPRGEIEGDAWMIEIKT